MDFQTSSRVTRSMLYVALSRVTSLTGLYILGQFKPPLVRRSTDLVLQQLDVLRSEKKLKLCFNNLLNTSGIIVTYLNARSLRKNLKSIISDHWYSRCHVLVFSESHTIPEDIVDIPGFQIFYRSDSLYKVRKQRGVIAFVRHDVNEGLLMNRPNTEVYEDQTSHVDIFSFNLNNTFVIAGYKSPSTSHVVFENCVTKMISQVNRPNGLPNIQSSNEINVVCSP